MENTTKYLSKIEVRLYSSLNVFKKILAFYFDIHFYGAAKDWYRHCSMLRHYAALSCSVFVEMKSVWVIQTRVSENQLLLFGNSYSTLRWFQTLFKLINNNLLLQKKKKRMTIICIAQWKNSHPNLPFWKLSTSSSPTQPPLFKQTKEEREISEKVIFLQQGSSPFLESQVKKKHKGIFQEGIALQISVSLKCL